MRSLFSPSTDTPLDNDDNVAALPPANEVTEAKHNNKSEADTTNEKKQAVSNADNDRKKNGSSITEARENYKFDVSKLVHTEVFWQNSFRYSNFLNSKTTTIKHFRCYLNLIPTKCSRPL